jgi:hypothetical protein
LDYRELAPPIWRGLGGQLDHVHLLALQWRMPALTRKRVNDRPVGKAQVEEGPMKTVWVYVNTAKELGDVDHVKVFANEDAANKWFEEKDPEGVAFEYPVEGS